MSSPSHVGRARRAGQKRPDAGQDDQAATTSRMLSQQVEVDVAT
jgi:hypothetical protein